MCTSFGGGCTVLLGAEEHNVYFLWRGLAVLLGAGERNVYFLWRGVARCSLVPGSVMFTSFGGGCAVLLGAEERNAYFLWRRLRGALWCQGA